MPDVALIRQKYEALTSALNERARRLWAATEARAAGRGGFRAVLRATGLSSKTLARGLRELESGESLPVGRIHRPGGGRKPAKVSDPGLMQALERLVEPATRGDPESLLRWTSKSTRRLAAELRTQGYRVSHALVCRLLHEAEYRLQAHRKTREGAGHPDRAGQFEHINRRAAA
jgi:transposase